MGSMVVHYQVQNGRILPHVIIQFFTLFDKAVFDVANSLVFLLVGQLILRHVWRGRGFSVAHELAVYVALWLFIPYFGQSVLWLSGGVNYLWMTALTLLTLLPYRLHEPGRPQQPWMVPLMLLAGLAAGGANENSGGAWILMALLFMVAWRLTGARVVPGWAWAGVIGAATAFLARWNPLREHGALAIASVYVAVGLVS
ncbi:MAG: DUF6056 family protein, partial [Propionibacteriaceae bacterium]|nr:DUF6056 family protein [Propionibacteriaceae bacterium]